MICLGACLSVNFTLAQKVDEQDNTRAVVTTPQVKEAVNFDISIPLSMMIPKPITAKDKRGGSMVDFGAISGHDGTVFKPDGALQSEMGTLPGPVLQSSWDAMDNVAGVSPPDPAGDIGPNHYVAMTNLFFSIYSRDGVELMGPLANNTVWSGFGGACENENSGDPIVLYDQISDRWLLSQFTSAGPQFFNCVALSTSPDPTGSYYRWAILNNDGTNDLFPDYPKYGVWEDGFYISTRDFNGNTYAGIGAYGIKREDMVMGNPTPSIVYFFIDRSTDPWRVGDGLLPADIDGVTMPPIGSPQYFVGTMDDGGPYGAAEDALSFWEFHADFDDINNSTFELTKLIIISEYDTQFPCDGRSCIAQLGTTNGIDIQSYRQRPLHRLAYRNFGTHESLVTNQSVEADPNLGGIRWWELRQTALNPAVDLIFRDGFELLDIDFVLHQEGTFAPGVDDGISRWMASIAQDSEGNMGLAYSASSSAINPGIRFTGRLESDALNSMNRGEGTIVDGTGSLTTNGRWGDYTSVNVDPIDDCTFWHVNQYLQNDGGNWQIRVGSFKFNECGDPGFVLNTDTPSQAVCSGDDIDFDINLVSVGEYDGVVTLSATGEPAGSTVAINPNPVMSLPNNTTFSITNTGSVSAGDYVISLMGTSPGVDDKNIDLALNVENTTPTMVTLDYPIDGETDVDTQPSLNWFDIGALEYLVEVSTDVGFNDIVFSGTITGTTIAPAVAFSPSTEYFWRVTGTNACGTGIPSNTFSFTTANEICFDIGQAITDDNPTGDDFVGTVTDSALLDSLTVSVDAAHTWVGDLIFTLSKDATSVVLMDRPGFTGAGFGCGNDDVDVVFDDNSSVLVEDECSATPPAIGGVVQPEALLNVFNGIDVAGDWTLNISDNAGADTGTLNRFCLIPVYQ